MLGCGTNSSDVGCIARASERRTSNVEHRTSNDGVRQGFAGESGCTVRPPQRHPRSHLIRSSTFSSSHKGTSAQCGQPPRGGYTLLEILIVGVLVSVLMLGVWSLLRTWSGLYEKGERRVQSAQLVRSLCDQFTDDVRAVAYVAPPPQRRRGGRGSGQSRSSSRSRSAAGGNLALVGGTNWLALEVLQPPSPYVQSEIADKEVAEESTATSFYAPELQRVMYTFEPPASDALDGLSSAVSEAAALDDTEAVGGEEESVEPFTGLLRIVVPVEQYEELVASEEADGFSRSSPGLSDAAWQLRQYVVGTDETDSLSAGTLAMSSEASSDPSGTLLGIVEQDEVPEVVWLEFRYFDGTTWRGSWNSQSEGRLPVAVELRFELKEPEDEQQNVSPDGETELMEDVGTSPGTLDMYPPSDGDVLSPSDLTLDSIDTDYEETPYHRCIVYLEPPAEQPPSAEEE